MIYSFPVPSPKIYCSRRYQRLKKEPGKGDDTAGNVIGGKLDQRVLDWGKQAENHHQPSTPKDVTTQHGLGWVEFHDGGHGSRSLCRRV